MFTYRSLTAADAQGWREIFVNGVKNVSGRWPPLST